MWYDEPVYQILTRNHGSATSARCRPSFLPLVATLDECGTSANGAGCGSKEAFEFIPCHFQRRC